MSDQRILIVDDSTVDRMILQRAFSKVFGTAINLEEAVDAQSAITRMDDGARYDAVFLDINMPGHSGFTVLRAIREKNQSTWPLVFIYSSSTHPDDISTAYAEQATAFLTKPADFKNVRALVASCGRLIADVGKLN